MDDTIRYVYALKLDKINKEFKDTAVKLDTLHHKIFLYVNEVDASSDKLTLQLTKEYTENIKKVVGYINEELEIVDDILDTANDDEDKDLIDTMINAEGVLDETKDNVISLFFDDVIELITKKLK